MLKCQENILNFINCKGTSMHVLRKHKGGREGVSQMLTFAYREAGERAREQDGITHGISSNAFARAE